MKKLTKTEIADLIVHMTLDYTQIYAKEVKNKIDKHLWAALHIGFITGMKQVGYEEEYLMDALSLAQRKLK